MTAFVLVHSPLVGPFTWALAADELRRGGIEAIVPELSSTGKPDTTYWKQHAGAVAQAIEPLPPDQPIVLIAHSGAGMLLPAIRQVLGRAASAYIFVDAGIPENGKSRLDLFEDPAAADNFREAATDGLLPVWTDEELREVIPDDSVRRRFVSELRPLPLQVYEEMLRQLHPRPLAFFEEPIPVFAGWPDAPCSYLLFSPVYYTAAEQARQLGWTCVDMPSGHFHMLVDPHGVADALFGLAGAIGLQLNVIRGV